MPSPTIQVREGLYYNPYFPGGAIAMPKMLVDGGTDYDDGTPASASQQAKDVTTFLTWTCCECWVLLLVASAGAGGGIPREGLDGRDQQSEDGGAGMPGVEGAGWSTNPSSPLLPLSITDS